MKFGRPYLKPDKTIVSMPLERCLCGEKKRGPLGGVCEVCGGAILTIEESHKFANDRENWHDIYQNTPFLQALADKKAGR